MVSGRIAAVGLALALVSCSGTRRSFSNCYDLPWLEPSFAETRVPGWNVRPEIIAVDTPSVAWAPRAYAIEIRAEQVQAGRMLGLDSLTVEGLPLTDAALLVDRCPPDTNFQYFYHCCLRTPEVAASLRPSNGSHNVILDLFVTVINQTTSERTHDCLSFELRGW
jgi:hypothetical protein